MQTTKIAPWVPERLIFSHFLRVPRLYYSNSMFNTFGKSLNRLIYIPTPHRFQNKRFNRSVLKKCLVSESWNRELSETVKDNMKYSNVFQISNTADTAIQIYIFAKINKETHIIFFPPNCFSVSSRKCLIYPENDSYDKTIIGWSRSSYDNTLKQVVIISVCEQIEEHQNLVWSCQALRVPIYFFSSPWNDQHFRRTNFEILQTFKLSKQFRQCHLRLASYEDSRIIFCNYSGPFGVKKIPFSWWIVDNIAIMTDMGSISIKWKNEIL